MRLRWESANTKVYGVMLPLMILPVLPIAYLAWLTGSAHDVYRQYQILVLIWAGLILLFSTNWRDFNGHMPLVGHLAIAFVALWGLASSFMADLPRWALLEWADFWLLGCLAVLTAQARIFASEGFDRWAPRLLILGASLYAALSLMFYFLGLGQTEARFDEHSLFAAFSNRRFFGHYQTLVFPFIVLLLLQAKSRFAQAAFLALLLWWWVLVFAAGTRGTILAVGGASLLMAVMPGSRGRPWFILQLLAAIVGWLVYQVLFRWMPSWLGALVDADMLPVRIFGLSGRGAIWTQALEDAVAHPWFGIGPMHSAAHPTDVAAHPHSLPLQLLAEWGMPVAILVLAAVLYGLVRLYRAASKQDGELLHIALFGALSGAFIQSLVDGVHVMPYGQTLVAVMIGWALAKMPAKQVSEGAMPISDWGVAYRGITLVAIVALLLGVAPEIMQLNQWEESYFSPNATRYWLPRFWLQGMIDRQER